MKFKRLHTNKLQFKQLRKNVSDTQRTEKIFTEPVPDFLCHCKNVINIEKRIAFRIDVPCDTLFCCATCPQERKKQCREYDWIGEEWW